MSAPIAPLAFRWDGESMVPVSAVAADRQYAIGETYRLVPYEGRSHRSHNHYFAAVEEAWRNLPETLADQFPTPEHLRKYALIKAGYRDQTTIALATKEDAKRIARVVRGLDEFALVTVVGTIITVYTARSQSTRAMGAKTFQQSKNDVLDVLAGMIGVETDTLHWEAGQAA